MCDKIDYKRLQYKYEGQTIYEWYQTLEEVHVFIQPPPGVTAKMIDCKITASRLTLGIKGNPPFIDVRRAVACTPQARQLDGIVPLAGGIRGVRQLGRELLDDGCATRVGLEPARTRLRIRGGMR